MDYEVIIGLEIHCELKTASKMFCGCDASFGGEPNSKTCPICLGLPGVLPVVNRQAVEFAVKTGLALNCSIEPESIFHRKNYFYPDMPKNYQISQYDLPLAVGGYLDVEMPDGVTRVGITRVHMEEDTGKSVHVGESGRIHGATHSLEDFNRAGVPLMEIVSEPDLRSPEQARAFMTQLKSLLEYLQVSDVKMEEGSLRCDANVSLRRPGGELGVKVEVKNMNSLRALERALAYEVQRQTDVLDAGGELVQETRHWDASANLTSPLRSKEYSSDYRYFPEPDLVPIRPDRDFVEDLRAALPELPAQRKKRLVEQYGLPAQDALLLTTEKAVGDYFEAAASGGASPKLVANWVMGELLAYLNTSGIALADVKVTPADLAAMVAMVEDGTISGKIAKTVFAEMLATGKPAQLVVEEKGLLQISDAGELSRAVAEAIAANPGAVEDFRAGKEQAVGFLVGQVMKATAGKANPKKVGELVRKALGRE